MSEQQSFSCVKHMETMSCPICEKDVVSDATAGEYCAMCAMPIKDMSALTKRDRETKKHFCSARCRVRYVRFHGA